MDREVLVYVDLNGVPYLVGRLWARTRKNTEGATFEYDARWLEHRERFSLEPALNEDDNTASLDVAMGVAPYFELDDARARAQQTLDCHLCGLDSGLPGFDHQQGPGGGIGQDRRIG